MSRSNMRSPQRIPHQASRTRSRSGRRNQRATGTGEPHLRAVENIFREQRLHPFLKSICLSAH